MTAHKRPSPEITTTVIQTGMERYEGCDLHLASVYNNSVVTISHREYSGVITGGFPNVPLPFNPYGLIRRVMTPSVVENGSQVHYAPDGWCESDYKYTQRSWWAEGVDYMALHRHLVEAEAACSAKTATLFNDITLNLSMVLAERQQTINLVANTAMRLVHAARAVKRLDLVDAARALGCTPLDPRKERAVIRRARAAAAAHPPHVRPDIHLSSAWLEFQYGWQPLLSDAYGAAELLGSRMRADKFNTTKVASASASKSTKMGFAPYLEDEVVLMTTSTCKYIVTFATTNEVKQAFAATGISNPLLLAWELVPYSFVIDWFYPVGNFLEQLTAYDGFDILSCNRVRFTVAQLDAKIGATDVFKDQWFGWTRTWKSGGGSGTGITYDRQSIGRPVLFPPMIKSPVSISHAASALALLSVTFGR